jgi:hypothetical protein
VAHILGDSTVPVEHVRYELVDLVVHSLRAMDEHRHLTTNWAALLRALETDDAFVSDARTKLAAVKQRVILRMLACSAEIEGQAASSGSFMTEYLDPYLVAALRSSTQDLEVFRPSNSKKHRVDDSTFEALTDVLLRKLPSLLVTFKGEGSILQSLTSLPQYLCTFFVASLDVSCHRRCLSRSVSFPQCLASSARRARRRNSCSCSVASPTCFWNRPTRRS